VTESADSFLERRLRAVQHGGAHSISKHAFLILSS